jgi:hypothetical protein
MHIDHHTEMAKEIREIDRLLRSVHKRASEADAPPSISKPLHNILRVDLVKLKEAFDIQYSKDVTQEQFEVLKHIYYDRPDPEKTHNHHNPYVLDWCLFDKENKDLMMKCNVIEILDPDNKWVFHSKHPHSIDTFVADRAYRGLPFSYGDTSPFPLDKS